MMPKKTTRSTPPGDDQPPPRRRPGRPRRTPEQLDIAKERRIPKSQKGRLKFLPGDPHALDVQFEEARNYRHLIAAKIEHLQALVAELDASQDDPGAAISAQEAALKSFLWVTYQDHKHRDHILATFVAIRRARMLARLDAAAAALQTAADLLAPDESLLAELRAAVDYQREAADLQRQAARERAPEQDEQPQPSGPQLRVTGPDEVTVQAQLDAIRTEHQAQEDPTKRSDHRHIYGDVQSARQRLARFEAQAAEIRAALSPAIGWFETFYIEKVRLNREALRYLKKGQELPPDVELFEGIVYGPYLKYRWQEVTGGPQYTIQMGLIPEDKRGAQEDEESGDPYPHL